MRGEKEFRNLRVHRREFKNTSEVSLLWGHEVDKERKGERIRYKKKLITWAAAPRNYKFWDCKARFCGESNSPRFYYFCVYGSSWNFLFVCLIRTPSLYLFWPKIAGWDTKKSTEKTRRNNKTKIELFSWTAAPKNTKIWEYYCRLVDSRWYAAVENRLFFISYTYGKSRF